MQQPNKYVVQRWINERAKNPAPPPTMEEVRRQLGWWLKPTR